MKETAGQPLWFGAIQAARQAMDDGMGIERGRKIENFNRRAVRAVRALLPYCLHTVGDDSQSLIWVNRDYKPLGIASSSRVEYADYTWLHVAIDDPRISELRTHCKMYPKSYAGPNSFWLYTDASTPYHSASNAHVYADKLALIDIDEQKPS
jgi:hypothetical protein